MAQCPLCGGQMSPFSSALIPHPPEDSTARFGSTEICPKCRVAATGLLIALEKSPEEYAKLRESFLKNYPENDLAKDIVNHYEDFSPDRQKKRAQKEQLRIQELAERKNRASSVTVTTCDLKEDYEIIGPVYFQVSNKGLFSSTLSNLIDKHQRELTEMESNGQMSEGKADWGFLYGEWSVGQNDFDKAFFVAVQELKERAAMLGADAIIGMRQDIDMDTNGFAYFYLQMYGTAVKLKK